MATKKEEKKPAAEQGGEAPKKKGKLPLLIALVVLLGAGGAAAWYFLAGKGNGEAAERHATAPKPPVFVHLDPFTVNLSGDEGGQYLQVGATLRVLDQSAADAAKQYMPEIRHRILGLLASKRPAEISSGEGRERLAEEIRQNINNILLAAAGKPVKPVILDVTLPAAKAAPEKAAAAADKPAEGEAPGESAAAAAAPAAAGAPRPLVTLAKAAADDPAQSVFFTSFIIQ
jgi:flagellar FliL protein